MEENRLDRDAIRAMRRSYGEAGLESLPEDPFVAFSQWLVEAASISAIVEANAMVLSTLDDGDQISTRTVLLKDISEGGFTFFTNYSSRKARSIELNENVALLFPWYVMERQVAISGSAEKISAQESADYFATRPWSSQIGAWASHQSSPLSSREELDNVSLVQRKNGLRELPFRFRHIGVDIELLHYQLNSGKVATRDCMIDCAMSGITLLLIG